MEHDRLTDETVEQALEGLRKQGLAENTLYQYRGYLRSLQRYWGEKKLGPHTLAQWQQAMVEQGTLSNSSINTRISAANSLLRVLGHHHWQMQNWLPEGENTGAELSREEYFCLLRQAKENRQEQIYYIIKTLRCLGVRIGELPHITVDAVTKGQGDWEFQGVTRQCNMAEPLRGELLAYAERQGIRQGPIFISRSGRPIARSTVWRHLQRLCQQVQMDPQKATPRNLEQLYHKTKAHLQNRAAVWVEQNYAQMLKEENRHIGWDDGMEPPAQHHSSK